MPKYGSVDAVLTATGIQPRDLSLEDNAELEGWVSDRLDEVGALIERDRNRSDFDAEGWKGVVDSVANRWAMALVRYVSAHRDSAIIRVDDFRIESAPDRVPGKAVLDDLRRIPRKASDAQGRSRFVLGMGVVKVED